MKSFDFNTTILQGPVKFPSLMLLVFVVGLILGNAILKLLRNLASNRFFHRPLSVGEDFIGELYSLYQVAAVAVLHELSMSGLARFDVLEHLCHFADCVDATLDFKFGNHHLLSFNRN